MATYSPQFPWKRIHFEEFPEFAGSHWTSEQPERHTVGSHLSHSANISHTKSAPLHINMKLRSADMNILSIDVLFSLSMFRLLTGAAWNKPLLWLRVYLYASEGTF